MFQSFITAVDTHPHNNKYTHDSPDNNQRRDNVLRKQIRSLIESMPSSEICVQAVLNIGLPSSLLDFKKLSKIIDAESSVSSLVFTLTQLKALSK